jgi:hypothetical protein
VQHHNTQAERFGADAEEEEDGFVWRDVHTEDGTPYQVGYLKTDSAHLVEMPEPPSAGALNLNNAETKWFRVNWNVSTDGSETVFTDFVDFDTPAFPNLKKYRLFKQSWSYWTYRLEFEVSAAGSPRIYRFKSGGVEFQRTPLWATTWALRYNSDSEMISHLGRKFIP